MNEQTKKTGCLCPYCEEEIILAKNPYCQPCQVTLRYCLNCNIAVERDAEICPECGKALT